MLQTLEFASIDVVIFDLLSVHCGVLNQSLVVARAECVALRISISMSFVTAFTGSPLVSLEGCSFKRFHSGTGFIRLLFQGCQHAVVM